MNILPYVEDRYITGRNYKIRLRRRKGFNKVETLCKKELESIFNKIFIKCRPKWLQSLELDLYNEELSVALEYQGLQHYIYPNHLHHNIEEFKQQIKRDKLKRKLCKKNKIILLEIPFIVLNNKIGEYIVDHLRSYSFKLNCPKIISESTMSVKRYLRHMIREIGFRKRNPMGRISSCKYYLKYKNNRQVDVLRKKYSKTTDYISIIEINYRTYVLMCFKKTYIMNKPDCFDINDNKSYVLNINSRAKIWRELLKFHYILDSRNLLI